ncbi:nitrogenase component 1 [Pseudoramibacter sp. HA2172]|uniref:nitrogenase component 1 n=1 Tax=Pseudoramibacter faecis TaxID=3108534 RepID=UPI002E759AE6|nr:nitrogenase component 1 [Pseudoramibacter sp. HA2172]
MKGLRKVLTPFAPDQSGAVSVLYELGGIIVVVDAGGCTGNICGFDEPRWLSQRSAVFSAGLRDMDAIMGRDDRLIDKLALACDRIEVHFVALVGTPVPAVIGTDFRALKRMAEKRTGLPVISLPTDGMALYDRGASAAFAALFETFAEPGEAVAGHVGVLGATPLDMDAKTLEGLSQALKAEGFREIVTYGMGANLPDVCRAACAEKNLVVAPSGLEAARRLEARFGTPYEVAYPAAVKLAGGSEARGRRVLVVHQQVAANTLREQLLAAGAASVTVGCWFMMDPALTQAGDVALAEEDDFTELAAGGGFDMIAADPTLEPLAPDFNGEWLPFPHFALSGKLGQG